MFYYQNNILSEFDIKLITKYLQHMDDFKCNPKCSDTSQFEDYKWYQEDGKYFARFGKLNTTGGNHLVMILIYHIFKI